MTDVLDLAGLHVDPADRARLLGEVRAGALRAWDLHRRVDELWLRWPKLGSSTLTIGQYWADEGDDAVHPDWLHAQAEAPRLDPWDDDVDDPAVLLPDLTRDEADRLDREGRLRFDPPWPDNGLAIPLFGAWGVDDGEQFYPRTMTHRPALTWARRPTGAALSWHPPARPHLDGVAPQLWSEGSHVSIPERARRLGLADPAPELRAGLRRLAALGTGLACVDGDDLRGTVRDRLVLDCGVDPEDAFALDAFLARARRGALQAWGIRDAVRAHVERTGPDHVPQLVVRREGDRIELALVRAPRAPAVEPWTALDGWCFATGHDDRARAPVGLLPWPADVARVLDREAARLAWPLFAAYLPPADDARAPRAVVASWSGRATGLFEHLALRPRPWVDGVDPVALRDGPDAAWTHAAYTLAELAHFGAHGDLVLLRAV